jgi:hypothetical protein
MFHLGLNPSVPWSETLPSLRYFWDFNTVGALQIGPTSVKALSKDKFNRRYLTQEQRKDEQLIPVIWLPSRRQCFRHEGLQVQPVARRRIYRCLFAILWFCFPFLLCLLFVLSQAFLSRYPTFSPSSILSLNDVFCVWLSMLLPTLLAFVLCLRLWLLGLPSPL